MRVHVLIFFFFVFLLRRIRYQALMASIKMEEITLPAGCHLEPYLINLLHRCCRKPASKVMYWLTVYSPYE